MGILSFSRTLREERAASEEDIAEAARKVFKSCTEAKTKGGSTLGLFVCLRLCSSEPRGLEILTTVEELVHI